MTDLLGRSDAPLLAQLGHRFVGGALVVEVAEPRAVVAEEEALVFGLVLPPGEEAGDPRTGAPGLSA
jgi:hypothetical protein